MGSGFPGTWTQREEEKEGTPTGQGRGAGHPRASPDQTRHPRRKGKQSRNVFIRHPCSSQRNTRRAEAPATSLEVAGISLKTPEDVGAGRPPPQEEQHYLAGAWPPEVTLAGSWSWLLDSANTEEPAGAPGSPSEHGQRGRVSRLRPTPRPGPARRAGVGRRPSPGARSSHLPASFGAGSVPHVGVSKRLRVSAFLGQRGLLAALGRIDVLGPQGGVGTARHLAVGGGPREDDVVRSVGLQGRTGGLTAGFRRGGCANSLLPAGLCLPAPPPLPITARPHPQPGQGW